MIPFSFLSRHILSPANIKSSLHTVIYTRLGRERKLRSNIKFETQIRISFAIFKTSKFFDEDNIFLLLSSVIFVKILLQTMQTCLVALWLLRFFRCLRVFSLAAREKFLPQYTYLLPYIPPTRWFFWRHYLNCHCVQPDAKGYQIFRDSE